MVMKLVRGLGFGFGALVIASVASPGHATAAGEAGPCQCGESRAASVNYEYLKDASYQQKQQADAAADAAARKASLDASNNASTLACRNFGVDRTVEAGRGDAAL